MRKAESWAGGRVRRLGVEVLYIKSEQKSGGDPRGKEMQMS